MPNFDELRQRLLAERERLESEIRAVAEQPADYRTTEISWYGNHLADTGTDTFEDEKALALEAHLTGMLNQVNGALERMDHGTYGICENCHEPISPERLEALPYATTCLKCASSRTARAAGQH
jgi:DnaK suppressor protein